MIFFRRPEKNLKCFFQTPFRDVNLKHFYIFPKHRFNSLFIWMKAQHIWSTFYTVIEEGRLSFLVSILKTYLLRWRLFLFATKHYFEKVCLSFFTEDVFGKYFMVQFFLKILHQFSLWYIFLKYFEQYFMDIFTFYNLALNGLIINI